MIHIERGGVLAPSELHGESGERFREEARAFFEGAVDSRAQRWFEFDEGLSWLHRIAIEPLLELFHGKCAFCETSLRAVSRPSLELFRPPSGALNLDGQRAADHYWWLVFEWENLYPACPACSRTKGPRFPVCDERAPLGSSWPELRAEGSLLLDPCVDDPEAHLVFGLDGTVAAVHVADLLEEERERFGTPTRGQVTIDTFGLNRFALIDARRSEAAPFLEQVVQSAQQGAAALARRAEELLAPSVPFLLMKQQLLAGYLQRAGLDQSAAPKEDAGVGKKPVRSLAFATRGTAHAPAKAPAEIHRAFAQQAAWDTRIMSSTVEVPGEADAYRARTSYIERVEIHGFTSMRDFEFVFVNPESDSIADAPWLMLLGENGAGKTSVLKAIALALVGPKRLGALEAAEPLQDLSRLFHDGGQVRVFLSSQSAPLEVCRRGDRLEHVSTAEGARVFLRAFGPSRWFPLPGAATAEADEFVRVGNLFNPFLPLEEPERFLSSLDDAQWDDVAACLKDLLQLPQEGNLARIEDEVVVHLPGSTPTGLRSLSSGYEAVVAMATDMMSLLLQRWSSPRAAEGIVLIDEIGAHLHPRWKMRIVASLRRTFPRVQFVATTHEPLCLRGLRQGEILLLRREDDDVSPFRPRQDVAQLRIDQLLTSRMFGLHSTLDPELESQFDRYYTLLSRHVTALSEAERLELRGLRDTVGQRGILGTTRREQMIYEIIDEFIAKELKLTEEQTRKTEERWTKERVAAFWSKLEDPEEDA